MANDYAFRIFKSMKLNNQAYASIVAEAASKIAGINSITDWEWCLKLNTTYLDCPIANQDHLNKFIVAVHNPSLTSSDFV